MAIISNQETSSRHRHSEEQLQLRLDAMMRRHENDQAKIMKLEKENIKLRKKLMHHEERERTGGNTSPILVGTNATKTTSIKPDSNHGGKPTFISPQGSTSVRHVSFTPSTTPIRLDIREMDLPPLWLELVHAHLNATEANGYWHERIVSIYGLRCPV